MFTGLVQALGTVRAVTDERAGRRLRVAEPALAPKLELGESVAVDGACLTVVARAGDTFDFEAGPETLAKTTLGRLAPGARVNLESGALRRGRRCSGGHFVTGHVDCIGTVLEEAVTGDWLFTVWFGISMAEYEQLLMVGKGSIAVDGVSLTLVDVRKDRFSVMLIPHTRQTHDARAEEALSAAVNLEFDLIAKHVQKLFSRINTTT